MLIEEITRRREALEKAAEDVRKRARILSVREVELNERIGCVDGGLLVKRLAGLDIFFHRAIGVIYEFSGGKLVKVDYFPSAYVEPSVGYTDVDFDDSGKLASLARLEDEISLALEMLDKVGLLILDGSLFPQPGDKPSKAFQDKYENLLGLYEELLRKALNKEKGLVGVVEDSRGKRYAKFLGYDLVDSVLFSLALKKGEFLEGLDYTDNPKEHFILRDFDSGLVSRVRITYLKAAPLDLALRIEYLDNKPLENLASIVYSLSHSEGDYGYPSIILEADSKAKIREEEILAQLRILNEISLETRLARRNRRLI